MREGLKIEAPGRGLIFLTHLVLDFTGTLSLDGKLLPGVPERLTRLSQSLAILVLTADTFGTARKALDGLPAEVRIIQTGKDKEALIRQLGVENVCAIGNGNNDVDMVRAAALGIAVLGPEGCSATLLAVSRVAVRDILDALDLLMNPLRLKATLRN